MIDLSLQRTDLFGVSDPNELAAAEYYVGRMFLGNWDECTERARWCFEHVPFTGNLLLDEEDGLLLRGSFDAYVCGMYTAAIVLSDAFVERILTDYVESMDHWKSSRGGVTELVKFLRKKDLVDPYILDRIDRLHQIRNNFAHQRDPGHPWRLMHRWLKRRIHVQNLLHFDAQEAVCLAHGLAARIKRNFPRMGKP